MSNYRRILDLTYTHTHIYRSFNFIFHVWYSMSNISNFSIIISENAKLFYDFYYDNKTLSSSLILLNSLVLSVI